MNYYEKYLKYKNKYLSLKYGSGPTSNKPIKKNKSSPLGKKNKSSSSGPDNNFKPKITFNKDLLKKKLDLLKKKHLELMQAQHKLLNEQMRIHTKILTNSRRIMGQLPIYSIPNLGLNIDINKKLISLHEEIKFGEEFTDINTINNLLTDIKNIDTKIYHTNTLLNINNELDYNKKLDIIKDALDNNINLDDIMYELTDKFINHNNIICNNSQHNINIWGELIFGFYLIHIKKNINNNSYHKAYLTNHPCIVGGIELPLTDIITIKDNNYNLFEVKSIIDSNGSDHKVYDVETKRYAISSPVNTKLLTMIDGNNKLNLPFINHYFVSIEFKVPPTSKNNYTGEGNIYISKTNNADFYDLNKKINGRSILKITNFEKIMKFEINRNSSILFTNP